MTNRLIVVCFGFTLIMGCGGPKEKPGSFHIGRTDSLYSEILKENRKIFVHVPNADAVSPYLPQHYPVLYLLDGDAHFTAVVAMLQHLSANRVCPDMIVVAIPNTDRSRDLTPSHSVHMPGASKPYDFLKTTGGGEAFTAFLEKELIPYVDKNYPTAPYRMLVGHSFGGLFAINALINHPALFNSYVAIDPSMWWDERKLLNHSDSVLRREHFEKKTLFLSVANTMIPGMDTTQVRTDTSANSAHIRSIISLARIARKNSGSGLRFGWKYYPSDDHGSVPLISEYDAFRFIFDFYKPDVSAGQITPEFVNNHYKMISDKMGYQVLPAESVINELAYDFLAEKPDAALALFKLNTTNYPESANTFDGLGDAYLKKADTALAIKAYTQALNLKETQGTRDKLNKLGKK